MKGKKCPDEYSKEVGNKCKCAKSVGMTSLSGNDTSANNRGVKSFTSSENTEKWLICKKFFEVGKLFKLNIIKDKGNMLGVQVV